MGSRFKSLEVLVWLTQAGLSVILPPVFFIWGAAWLKTRFSLGGWILILGVALGLLGLAGGLVNTLKTLNRLGGQKKDRPAAYNDHD